MNGEEKGSEPVLKLTKRVENTLYSSLAQSVERMTVNHDVAGSSPAGGANKKELLSTKSSFFVYPSRSRGSPKLA